MLMWILSTANLKLFKHHNLNRFLNEMAEMITVKDAQQ